MGRGHRQGTREQPEGSRAISVKEDGCREDVKVLVYRIKVQGPRVVSVFPAQQTPDIWGSARGSGKGTQAEGVGRWEDGREYLEREARLREGWSALVPGGPPGVLGPRALDLSFLGLLVGLLGGGRSHLTSPGIQALRQPRDQTALLSEPGWGLQPAPTGTAAWKFCGQVRHGQRHTSAVRPVPTGHSPLCPVQDLSLLPKQRVQGPPSDSCPGQSLPGFHLSICLSPASFHSLELVPALRLETQSTACPDIPALGCVSLLPHSSLSCQGV